MRLLQRFLYLSAAAHLAGGVALLVAPGWAMDSLSQTVPNLTWIRLVGLQAIMTGLMQVIIGHRVETLWWFSWTFVFGAVASLIVFGAHLLTGLAPGEPALPWALLVVFAAVGVVGLLYGLARAGLEKPAE